METTFTLTITGSEHGEWQGILKTQDGTETTFPSLMTLLLQINRALPEEQAVHPKFTV